MKILGKTFFIFVVSFLLCANALCMDEKQSTQLPKHAEEQKSNEQNAANPLVASEKDKTHKILYDILDPLPMELIQIILGYLKFNFQGKLEKHIEIPANLKYPADEGINLLAALENTIAAGYKYTIVFVDAQTGNIIKSRLFDKTLTSLTSIKAQSRIVSGHNDGSVNLFDEKGKRKQRLQPSHQLIRHLAEITNSDAQLAVGDDSRIYLIDANGRTTRSFECSGCLALTQLQKRNTLLASSTDSTATAYDIKTGESKWTFSPYEIITKKLVSKPLQFEYIVSLDNGKFITAHTTNKWLISLWDLDSKKQLATFSFEAKKVKDEEKEDQLANLHISHNNILVAIFVSGRSHLFDLNTGKLISKFKPSHTEQNHQVLCSIAPDNQRIIQALKGDVLNIYS